MRPSAPTLTGATTNYKLFEYGIQVFPLCEVVKAESSRQDKTASEGVRSYETWILAWQHVFRPDHVFLDLNDEYSLTSDLIPQPSI